MRVERQAPGSEDLPQGVSFAGVLRTELFELRPFCVHVTSPSLSGMVKRLGLPALPIGEKLLAGEEHWTGAGGVGTEGIHLED